MIARKEGKIVLLFNFSSHSPSSIGQAISKSDDVAESTTYYDPTLNILYLSFEYTIGNRGIF
jgi:hypothetical protein